ncbi:MAG: nucleotide exchange factor GrpE [Deltaproteobacteria bacterium]|nr:nucleotide exchange factor GrpE [Deltaproteobacteria bacterium]
MSDNEQDKTNAGESLSNENEKSKEECLKDSVKFEDFVDSKSEPSPQKNEGEIELKTVPADEYEKIKRELQDTTEILKRVAADFENYKKRIAREKEELQKFANESILRDLLETADNLELTLQHSRQAQGVNEDIVRGFEITVRGFLEFLKRYGVSQLEMKDNAFDPNYHEAIAASESDTVPAGQIIRVERKGYMLRDRLLRPALVVVSKGKASGEKKEPTEKKAEHICIAEPEPEQNNE